MVSNKDTIAKRFTIETSAYFVVLHSQLQIGPLNISSLLQTIKCTVRILPQIPDHSTLESGNAVYTLLPCNDAIESEETYKIFELVMHNVELLANLWWNVTLRKTRKEFHIIDTGKVTKPML